MRKYVINKSIIHFYQNIWFATFLSDKDLGLSKGNL